MTNSKYQLAYAHQVLAKQPCDLPSFHLNRGQGQAVPDRAVGLQLYEGGKAESAYEPDKLYTIQVTYPATWAGAQATLTASSGLLVSTLKSGVSACYGPTVELVGGPTERVTWQAPGPPAFDASVPGAMLADGTVLFRAQLALNTQSALRSSSLTVELKSGSQTAISQSNDLRR
ncbi:hypothetical protein WJX72_006535 [[Myrmecia] bisecta]|uniref:Uncharacterized protein n=1 Tax=[Myrmecia] bisecta TaxID=41462 RepID=A0AAW1PXQ3_9CHLO